VEVDVCSGVSGDEGVDVPAAGEVASSAELHPVNISSRVIIPRII
jgi:hypothetical protein